MSDDWPKAGSCELRAGMDERPTGCELSQGEELESEEYK